MLLPLSIPFVPGNSRRSTTSTTSSSDGSKPLHTMGRSGKEGAARAAAFFPSTDVTAWEAALARYREAVAAAEAGVAKDRVMPLCLGQLVQQPYPTFAQLDQWRDEVCCFVCDRRWSNCHLMGFLALVVMVMLPQSQFVVALRHTPLLLLHICVCRSCCLPSIVDSRLA
jgi:hypothetical protein